ncbi:hypothetical protein B0T24DRAFT_92141 [Lasiosphaeria ovina]|uniref:Uncharacterized protein n=1 Tax=Lasiosphaeria ovina TaxID=92902 RepID=A0AAE0TYV2_9PEZI|nr:hypothetical protein B0T24DRAFT_92141 [Lasiosphaeria ovina]
MAGQDTYGVSAVVPRPRPRRAAGPPLDARGCDDHKWASAAHRTRKSVRFASACRQAGVFILSSALSRSRCLGPFLTRFFFFMFYFSDLSVFFVPVSVPVMSDLSLLGCSSMLLPPGDHIQLQWDHMPCHAMPCHTNRTRMREKGRQRERERDTRPGPSRPPRLTSHISRLRNSWQMPQVVDVVRR